MIFDKLRNSSDGPRTLTERQLLDMIGGGQDTASGQSVSPESAMRFAYVFMCVRVLAEGVGMLPFHLFAQQGHAREKATSHPIYQLIHGAPNRFQTTQEWLETLIAHLALRGNHYSFINRVGKKLIELLPFHPDAVDPRITDDGGDVEYHVSLRSGPRVMTSAEVFHVKLFSQDGVKGLSPIAQAREAIGLGISLEKYASRFFKNGARPGGILATDQALGVEGRAEVETSWNAARQGVDKAHGVAVLEHGLKYQAIGLSAEDAQMIEARKMSRTDIAGLFRVPPSKIADLERATFSNGEQQGRDFVDYSLMPYLTRIEQRANLQLLDPSERGSHFFKFNTSALVRGDMAARAEFYTRQVQNGALSPNEIRELEDQNPRPGGDVYLTPANMLIDGKPPPKPDGGAK